MQLPVWGQIHFVERHWQSRQWEPLFTMFWSPLNTHLSTTPFCWLFSWHRWNLPQTWRLRDGPSSFSILHFFYFRGSARWGFYQEYTMLLMVTWYDHGMGHKGWGEGRCRTWITGEWTGVKKSQMKFPPDLVLTF